MNTAQTPSTTNSLPESDGSGAASTQNESQRQTMELLAKCLAALKNSVTREEWEILCARLNTVSSLLPPIADALGVPSKDSG